MGDIIISVSDVEPPPPHGYHLEVDTYYYRPCVTILGVPPYPPTMIRCQAGAVGRYVYVYRNKQTLIIMCEIEIFGVRKYKTKILHDDDLVLRLRWFTVELCHFQYIMEFVYKISAS